MAFIKFRCFFGGFTLGKYVNQDDLDCDGALKFR